MTSLSSIELTVVIPTYNRRKWLERCVACLLPQLIQNVEVIILDNCSDEPVAGYLNDSRIKVIRNPVNIGAVGNFLRAFEVGKGKWIWIMGDDDQPQIDGVFKAMETIRTYADANHIYFSNHMGPIHETGISCGVEDFCQLFKPEYFGGRLWVSSQLFNLTKAKPMLRYAYAYPGSSPHMSIALLQVEAGQIIFCPDEIAIHHEPPGEEQWNPHSIYSQMPQFSLLPVPKRLRRHIAEGLSKWYHTYYSHFLEVVKLRYLDTQDAEDITLIFEFRWHAIISLFNDNKLMRDHIETCEKLRNRSFIEEIILTIPEEQRQPFRNGELVGTIR